MNIPSRFYEAYIFDLDGTVYLGDAMLPTALETITYLREIGKRTVFLSNNPTRTREVYAQKLTRLGVPTPVADVVNSSSVMVDFLQQEMPDARLYIVGENSLCQELERAGFELVEDSNND